MTVKTDIDLESAFDSSAKLLRCPVCVLPWALSVVSVCVRSLDMSAFLYSSNLDTWNQLVNWFFPD
jgi:hypothetical protein